MWSGRKKKKSTRGRSTLVHLVRSQEDGLGLDYIRGPVLSWQIFFFISLAARSCKEYSERSFSGCPYAQWVKAGAG